LAREAAPSLPVISEIPEGVASAPLPEVDPAAPAVILYTSGTTSRPKGVVHSHRSLMGGVRMLGGDFISGDDIALSFTPMMHASGLMALLLPAVAAGATVVALRSFSPAAVLDAIERRRCTFAIALPALLQFVVEEQRREPRDVSSLTTMCGGGDTVPVALQDRFQKLFGIPAREGYAMTECVPISFNPPHAIRNGSLGTPSVGVEVRIVDLAGRDLPDGETGEVVVRSPGDCLGYWDDPAATEDLFRGGWLHTGDLACRDADGYLWFKGRMKQIIIRGGSNISPQEVEEALYRHPAVLEAGVVGQPDEVYGQLPVAFVTLRRRATVDERQLQSFARERMADYKVPERIFFLPELPKGITGKVDRRALKEMLLDGMACAVAA
jgi:long-chain acyl-CoA synthetase